jgi:hypothetical protein
MVRLRTWLLLLLMALPLAAQVNGNDKVTVKLSSDRIAMDETAILTLSISGLADGLDIPTPQSRDGGLQFTYSGRRISMSTINGTMTSSVEVDYAITPLRKGRHLIEPITGSVAGIPFTTPVQRLEVTDVGTGGGGGRAGASPWSSPPARTNPYGIDPWGWPPEPEEDVLLEAEVEPETVYKHQPVFYNLRLLATGRLRSDPRYSPIAPTGFLRLPFPQENSVEERGGRQYSVMSVKTAYFPLSEGEYTFDPSQVSITSLFSVPQTLRTETRKVKVLPLPGEGRPRSFTGAVGEQFEIRAALKTDEIEMGGNAELEVTVEGDGHLNLVPYPYLPDWSGLEKKQLSSPSTTQVVDRRIVSKRTYSFRLKPEREGTFDLSGIALGYFNPKQARYEVIKAPGLTLEVHPNRKAPSTEVSADRQVAESERPQESPGATTGRLPELPRAALAGGVILLLSGALLAVFGGQGWPRMQGRRKGVTAGCKSLKELLSTLERLAPGPDSGTRKEYLERQGWSAEAIARLEGLKRSAQRAAFAAPASSEDQLAQLNRELAELLKESRR